MAARFLCRRFLFFFFFFPFFCLLLLLHLPGSLPSTLPPLPPCLPFFSPSFCFFSRFRCYCCCSCCCLPRKLPRFDIVPKTIRIVAPDNSSDNQRIIQSASQSVNDWGAKLQQATIHQSILSTCNREKKRKKKQERDVCSCFGCLTSQQHASVSQGRICSILRAATLRQKLQIQLSTSPSHNILTPGQPVPALTL